MDAPILNGTTAALVRALVKLLEDEQVADCVQYCHELKSPRHAPEPSAGASGDLRYLVARLGVEL